MEVLNIRIKIMKRKNIMLTASIMADTYSGISCACIRLHLRARMEMVAVLLYRPPIMPETKVPDSRYERVYTGFLLASPYVIYQLFRFVSPALYENEKKYSTRIL